MKFSVFCLLLAFVALTPLSFASDSAEAHLESIYDSALEARSFGRMNEARALHLEAATKGYVPSMLELGALIGSGVGGPANGEEALDWFLKARDTGEPEGVRFYASLQLNSELVGVDYIDVKEFANPEAGMRTLKQLAEQGDAPSMVLLGVFHDQEIYGRRDARKALHWYQKAVNAGMSDYASRAEYLRAVIETTPEQKRADYEKQMAAAAPLRHPWQQRSQAFVSYMKMLSDSGLPEQEISGIAGPAFDDLVKTDFYAISLLVANPGIAKEVRDSLEKRLSEAQQAELQRIRAHRVNPKAPKPHIKPGEGWTEGAATAVAQVPSAQDPAASGPSVAVPTDPAKPRLAPAIANAKSWDDLFDAVAAEKYKFAAENHGKHFAAHFPSPPEEIRDAYRRALARNKPRAEDKPGEFSGRMFLAYHQALLARNLAPQAAADFSREDFLRMANADIHAAFEGIPSSPHMPLFRRFLSQNQNNQITAMARGALPGGGSAGTQQTAATGFRTFQEYRNDFRRNLPGHWSLTATVIGEGGRQYSMEVRFDERNGQVTTMVATPLGRSPSNHPVHIQENKSALWGGSWFKLTIRYESMRLEGMLRNDGSITGEVYNQHNQQIGNWQMLKRLDLDYYALAQQAERAKNIETALHYYGEAIKHRRNAAYYVARAVIHYDLKEYEVVIRDLTEALRLEPKNANALYNRALGYYYSQNYEEALADLDTFIAEHRGHSHIGNVHFQRGETLWWLKRHEDANKAYATAVARNPQLAERTRVANTREGAFASIAESAAETNRIMNRLGEGLAASNAQLAAANRAAIASRGQAAAGGAPATADSPVIPSSPVEALEQLYAVLMENLAKPENRKTANLTEEQEAALKQVLILIPPARTHAANIRNEAANKLNSTAPGTEAFYAGNKAFNAEDMAEAMRQWEQAAALGHPTAMLYLAANIYANGVPGIAEQDHPRTRELIRKAAEMGHPAGYADLSAVYGGLYGATVDHVQGLAWAIKADESGYSYGGYLRYYHVLRQRIHESNNLTLRTPNSAEAKAVEEEVEAALASLRRAALLGENSAMYALARYHYQGQLPGLRAGFSAGRNRTALNLPLSRFWFEQALEHDKRQSESADNDRNSVRETVAAIDATLALSKGREWNVDEILSALEAGIPQQALTYMINREKARLTKRDNTRLVASEAWKQVPQYGSLNTELMMHVLLGPDQEARAMAEAAIAERRQEVKASPTPEDTPELRKRYAAGDPAAAYTLLQALHFKYPFGWPETEPKPLDVRAQAVTQDYAPAQYLVVDIERLEHNTDKSKLDHARMVKLVRTAAEAGNAEAALRLANLYAATGRERGVRRNLAEAEYWYIQAGALAWPDQFRGRMGLTPQPMLAQIYSLETPLGTIGGTSLRPREEATQRWIRELRRRGGDFTEIIDEKITYYGTREGGNIDMEALLANLPAELPDFDSRELSVLEHRAKNNDLAALLSLANAYAHGERGLRQRDDLAVELYHKAAGHGSREAMAALAEHYEKGYGVNKDFLLATQWKARAEGKMLSPVEAVLTAGELAQRDPDLNYQAEGYYRQAAEAGHAEGMYRLAHHLSDTRNPNPDIEASFSWLQKAAQGGSALAMAILSSRYEKGENGAPQDPAQSFYWLEKAAEAGDRLRMPLVAFAYERGTRGATKDRQKALYWYRKALEAGDERSRSSVERLENELGITTGKNP